MGHNNMETAQGNAMASAITAIEAFKAKASRRTVNEIIIHCSATPEGRDVHASDIRRWHINERGFSDIGYHFVITLDGTVEAGRPLQHAGAHCSGHNSNSIGLCYIGGLNNNFKPCDTRTASQRRSLNTLIDSLKSAFPKATVYGHRDFARKDCPCFNARDEYAGTPNNTAQQTPPHTQQQQDT